MQIKIPWASGLATSFLSMILLITAPASAKLVDDLESPVTTPARWVLIGGTGLTLAVLATQDSVANPFEKDTVEHKPLGSSSKYGDLMGQLVPNAAYIGGMLISSYAGSSLGYYRAELMFEATAYAALITTALKYTIREPRPYDGSVRNSFPSGHATTAFAFAGVVAAEHGWWYGAPAMGLATFVAYSRINDNQHHLQDVVAGGTIGLTCAYGVYYAHKEQREKAASSFHIVPIPLPGGAEVAMQWSH
jgi:hypothetical protein